VIAAAALIFAHLVVELREMPLEGCFFNDIRAALVKAGIVLFA
jgi:hypothetical protein